MSKTHYVYKALETILVLLGLHFSASSFAAEDSLTTKPVTIDFKDALQNENLSLEIKGVYNPRIYFETTDRSGMHYGKCMVMSISSKIDTLILLRLPAGIEVIPEDSSYQTMIVTREGLIPLYPNTTYRTLFYAMCGQMEDLGPNANTSFTLGDFAQPNVVRLAEYIDANHFQNIIGQHALWAVTDDAELKDLEKYGADSISIIKTIDILRELNLSTALSRDHIEPERKEYVFTIPRYWLFAGVGIVCTSLMMLLLGHFYRKRKTA